jgi:hypothetical protein
VKLICRFGEMWARNQVNISKVPGSKEGGKGILYDGSMPVYVGKGGAGKSSIHRRIVRATKSKTRSPFWDHFSWYVLDQPKLIHDAEVLLLRMLPPYLRSLTKQSGHFLGTDKHGERQQKREAVFIPRKAPRKKHQ